jgi:hypothetical protein
MRDTKIEYRAYIIDGNDHFSSLRTFACDHDADAIKWAKQMVEGHDVELWSGTRFIIRLTAYLRK